MTLTEGLNRIYEETYGEHAPHSNASAIDAVNDLIKKGGGTPVTELGDGIYKLASGGSSGGGALVVEFGEFVHPDQNTGYFQSDVSYDDVVDAYVSGKQVVFYIPGNETYSVYEGYFTVYGYAARSEDGPLELLITSDSTNVNGFSKDDNGYIVANIFID